MWFVFVDESGDKKRADYLGISLVLVNCNFYGPIKRQVSEILQEAGWDPLVEFKGSALFSAKKGCEDVSVENRVEAAEKILSLAAAEKNKRMKFFYMRTATNDHKSSYLALLPLLLKKALPKNPSPKQGKNLVVVFCDERQDVSVKELKGVVDPILQDRGYTLVEDVVPVRSHSETVGVLFADIVGYLLARIDTITEDKELFEKIPPEYLEMNGTLRKLKSSIRLISLVRDIKRLAVEVKKS